MWAEAERGRGWARDKPQALQESGLGNRLGSLEKEAPSFLALPQPTHPGWIAASYRDTGEFPPDMRKEKLLCRGASKRLLPAKTWRGPVTEPAGLPATCSGCLGFCHEGWSCPAPLSLCKANTPLGEKRAEGRRAGNMLEAQPAHCPPQSRLTRAGRRMGAPTPQSPVPPPALSGPHATSATKTLLLLLEEGVGRPEGKAGPAERKLGEAQGNRKGKATPPAVGGEQD